MGEMDIAFPNLGIYLTNVPKTIMIGNFGIALYGIIIAIGMLLGLTLASRIADKEGLGPDVIWDLGPALLLFSVIGARIYYVIFMWDMYKDDPIQILNLRGGGLAIYGGIIAGFITIYAYCRIKKIKFPRLLDPIMYGLLIGQILGRWGNFFNREVFGEYTDNLFAMRIPVSMVRERDISASIAAHMTEGTNYIQVHPTFLYEGMWNLMILLFLLLYRKHKKFDGEIALFYFAGYGIGRAIIESIRTDQLYITGTTIPVSKALGIAMAVVSITADLMIRAKKRKSTAAEAAGGAAGTQAEVAGKAKAAVVKDGPQAEASGKAEEPKAEVPKAEEPKAEEPKAESPDKEEEPGTEASGKAENTKNRAPEGGDEDKSI